VSRTVEPATAWGVGRVGTTPWPVSPADIADETAVAVEHLRMLGLEPGGLVLIVSRLSETIHVAPIEIAAGRLDARWSSSDATEGDAFRAASLVRQLAPDIVIGVNATIVNALENPREAFASVPVVAVTDKAARDALPNSRWWLRLGPTNAFECAERQGAHYDATRWAVEESPEGIVVSNLTDRLTTAERFPTKLRGRVDPTPCACGRTSPRVVPE
jgi:hypothetical protein